MKKRNTFTACCCVAVLSVAAQVVTAAVTLPFTDSFESGLSGSWSASGGGDVAVDGSAALTGAGSSGLIVSNDTASLDVGGTDNNAWIQIYAQPARGEEDPTISDDISGAFYVTTGGVLRAYDNNGWSTAGTGLGESGWVGFIVHVDYASGKWDLYHTVSPHTYESAMVKGNSAPLDIKGTATVLDTIKIKSGEKAYVDAIASTKAIGDVTASSPDNVAVHTFDESVTTGLSLFTLPVYSDAYTNPASANRLDGLLGQHLAAAMFATEELHVHGTNSWGWDEYDVSGAGTWQPDGSTIAAVPVSVRRIWTFSRLMILLNSGRDNTTAFIPYDSVVAQNGALDDSVASGLEEDLELNGTAAGNGGWTGLQWSDDDPLSTFLHGQPTAGIVQGDRLYIEGSRGPFSFDEYVFDGSQWIFYGTGQGASGNVPKGANMWVQRLSTGQGVVTVTH